MIHLSKIPPDVRPSFTGGNRVTPLFGADMAGDIFVRTRELIVQAETCVEVEMFDIGDPGMVNLLIAKARQGVAVHVIVQRADESEYTAPRREAIKRLRQANVQVHISAKAGPMDHVKLLIVDGRAAVIGGMNWGVHSPANHDFCVEIEGPAVAEMAGLFEQHWRKPTGVAARPAPAGDAAVNLLTSGRGPGVHSLRRGVLRAIATARRSIHAEMFVLTNRDVIDALIAARARGVDVKIILDPLVIGEHRINEAAAEVLKRNGVEVRWFRCNPNTDEKLHAKLGIFDDDQIIVGSANWSTAGLCHNREADVEILSPRLNHRFDAQFASDWRHRATARPHYLPTGP